ncbi:hypothetical protein DEHALATV1_0096 [Dehalococcoides mccartyi]|uniref:Uncharacterized protein n=1 Tax=Dehalococcoides mccartyi TaxID=61435 RepID=A0AB33HSN0_9CHLR|nr:hypothetical protein IBK_0124 [Dehalococcoides mccartyi IBARAKI]BAZ96724.1 hypothetical protein DEHALATV1_0096 [Dehalococcoides mccartyi]
MTMKLTKRDSGRIGGIQTVLIHGADHMRNIGKLGGRPRSTNWLDLQVRQIQERREKGGRATDSLTLSQLKHLVKSAVEGGY